MSDVQAFKSNLLAWHLHSHITVPTVVGPVQLDVRRPPKALLAALFEKAQKDGLINEEHAVQGTEQGLRLMARITALCLFQPGGVRPLLTEDEALHLPTLDEVGKVCTEAIGDPNKAIEALQGNFEATPS